MAEMTSLLPSSQRPSNKQLARRTASEIRRDLATRRPLVLVATLGGAVAAAATLLVCLAVGVVGWFLSDGGSHGTPRGGLTTGALAWLMGHGSGVHVTGVAITVMPLGITAICAWTTWRVGLRVGASISGHGPDADQIADGQRDLTVPTAAALLAAGYVLVALAVITVAATPATDPSTPAVVGWSLAISLLVGAPAIAIGSGRAAIWTSYLPPTVRASAGVARRVLVIWGVVSLVAFVVALALDLSTAANMLSQLHTDAGATVLIVLVTLLVVPNAVVFSGSYLLGPGFSVGTGTLVAPSAVVLGPLPLFPVLAALPDNGATASWTAWLIVLPPLVAFVAVLLAQRANPTTRYEEGATRGCAGGVVAGLAFGVAAALAGGAVGPGRMRDVTPYVFDSMIHAVTSFGLGGLLGGLAMTWWQRRTMQVEVRLED